MKCRNPDSPSGWAEEIDHALFHLAGGLIGECHGEDLAGRGLAGCDQMSDSEGDDAGLAGASPGDDEDGAVELFYRLALARVEVL